jgi:hypothetical protein
VQSNGTKAQLQQRLLGIFGLITPAPHATAALLHILALERSDDVWVRRSKVYKLFERDQYALYIANLSHSILPYEVGYDLEVCGITLSNSPHSYCLTA